MSVQHESWIKTPKQLVIVIVVAFVVPITLIVLLSQLFTGGEKGAKENDVEIMSRIQPVGQVVLATPGPPKGQSTGEQVFGQTCKICHEAGIAGAPKFGDKAAWAPRIAQGLDTLVGNAIKGKGAMPPRGGTTASDAEIRASVMHMVNAAK